MAQFDQFTIRNRLLKTLTPDDFGLIEPHLRSATTELSQMLIEPYAPIERMFFPQSGFASITTEGPGRIEVGMIGSEGVVGIAALLGDTQSPYEHFVQAAGEVLSVNSSVILAGFEESRTLRKSLLHYVHTLMIQTAQTAFVNAAYDVEARLVRWLLMCQDRMGGNELALTHDFLAMMLGVQRTSVTLSLQTLEGSGLIKARRGRIEIRDREGMIAAADKGYGIPEAAYERLFGG